jgi:methylated-DNA-[protein]-cysteine S-methyltransferase
MTPRHSTCRAIEADLVAAATGEATAIAARRVQEHVVGCASCRQDFERYRVIDAAVGELQGPATGDEREPEARRGLAARLADLRRRLVLYKIFPSPVGNLLLAQSEDGVSLVEYLGAARTLATSRLARASGVEAVEDGAELDRLHRDILDYLAGRRTALGWPLDFRLARGDFDRLVLDATSKIPYGAVTSYAQIAEAIGKPSAARAVAQALRWNPLPLVVPCHRIIGSSGALVGYAGHHVALKHRLLAVEGVRTVRRPRDWEVARTTMYARYANDAEYCLPTCASLSRMSLAKLTLFGSRERAEALGLAPCTTCRPDLHPLIA